MTPGGVDAGPGITAPEGLDEGRGSSAPGVREPSREAGWARPAVGDRERLARAALTRVLEPGDERGGRWLREIGAAELIRRITDRDGTAEQLRGMTPKRLAGYRLRAEAVDPERDLVSVAAVGGRFVCPGDREWPSQLDDLGDSRPTGLWVRGRPDLRLWALRSVAVVGARACTPYGAHMAASLGAGLAELGWVVVSGAAFGVDGAAHRGALSAGGATMAVLACGVDVAYPRGHAELIGRVAEQGLVIGELPPADHPTRSRFILRNRVIAALTRGTVVVEAEYRSGSLVTARSAQRLGRFTMGVPGPATSGLSAGVHELLRARSPGHRRRGSRRTGGGDRRSRPGPARPRAPQGPVGRRLRPGARRPALPRLRQRKGHRPHRRNQRRRSTRQIVRTALTGVRRTHWRRLAVDAAPDTHGRPAARRSLTWSIRVKR